MKLPVEKNEIEKDISRYTFLVYGREKVGKTVLLSQWPDALFLLCEPGAKGLEIYKIDINNWRDVRDAVTLLERDAKFTTIVIDTIDLFYNYCLDYVCEKYGIPYPGKDLQGKEDFGKSWRDVKIEFTDIVNRILKTGRGLAFISHAKIEEHRDRSTGETWSRVYPSVSNQASRVIEALVDIYLYADYMKTSDGKNIRVLICEGNEGVWAGYREPARFPQILPLEREGGYEIVRDGFLGRHRGLDPKTLLPVRATAPAAKNLVRDMVKNKKSTAQKRRK